MIIPSDLAKKLTHAEVGQKFDGITVVEQHDWIVDGDTEYGTVIFLCEGNHYCLSVSRTGNNDTEYHYDYEDGEDFKCAEVFKREVVAHEWVEI